MSKRRYKNFFNGNTKSRKMYVVATQMKALDALNPNMIFKTISGMVVCELRRIYDIIIDFCAKNRMF